MKSKRKTAPKSKPAKPRKQKEKVGLNQKEKSKFRSSESWKMLRNVMTTERVNVCDCCNRHFPSSKLHIHHKNLDSTQYTNITTKAHFSVLCGPCHDTVHWMHTLVISKQRPTTNQKIIDFQSPYFL